MRGPAARATVAIMFSGIIERTAKVFSVNETPMFRRLTIGIDWFDATLGQSIAINGVCLTAAEVKPGQVGFDVITETLAKTNLGLLKAGDLVNIERSLRVGDRIDGHFVQGHVDAVGKLARTISTENEFRLAIEPPAELRKYIVPKGSVSIDGVSLTVASVSWPTFEVALIPTTLHLTTLGSRPAGWLFNLETDIISKTIVSFLEQRQA